MSATLTSRLVVDALGMAVSRRGPVAGVIAHSDRGSQYASDHFQGELRRHQMVGSTSGVGQCWDNAVVESTFGRIKVGLCHHESYATREQAKASLFEYLEVFDNRVRRHSTLECLTPDESSGRTTRTAANSLSTFHWEDQLGRPPPEEEVPASDPRVTLAEAVTYLRSNADRMPYPRYRREGLPTTSSLVESLVGEFNARVKGRSKFWNRPSGAEVILQVRAALLSEDGRLERFFANRPGRATRRHAT